MPLVGALEGWMDCRSLAFFSPGDITELRPIEPSLAPPNLRGEVWQPPGSGLPPARLGGSPFQPPVLEAGEATSSLPDQSSVVANPDAHRGAQVLQRARGGPAFLHQGNRQDERVAHLRMAL